MDILDFYLRPFFGPFPQDYMPIMDISPWAKEVIFPYWLILLSRVIAIAVVSFIKWHSLILSGLIIKALCHFRNLEVDPSIELLGSDQTRLGWLQHSASSALGARSSATFNAQLCDSKNFVSHFLVFSQAPVQLGLGTRSSTNRRAFRGGFTSCSLQLCVVCLRLKLGEALGNSLTRHEKLWDKIFWGTSAEERSSAGQLGGATEPPSCAVNLYWIRPQTLNPAY